MRAGADTVNFGCCALSPNAYVIVASVIILLLGILMVLDYPGSWYMLVVAVIILALAIVGFRTNKPLVYLILGIIVIVLAILGVIHTVLFILNNGFTLIPIINIVLNIIFIIFLVHLAYVAFSLRG
ncbi:hypothetical protein RB195_009295 [Necator americanus]